MFDLKKPCSNCPFRKGRGSHFRLTEARIQEIVEAPAFQCHKTVDYTGSEPNKGDRPQQCAGLMAVLARENKPSAIMQVGSRLGRLDLKELDPDHEVYDYLQQAVRAHTTGVESNG